MKRQLENGAVGNQPAQRKWRLQAKNLFLTFPQCQTTKERCLELIRTKFDGSSLEFAVVAQEDHQEEDGLHLHILISLKRKYRSRNVADLDCLVDPPKHGNYQSALKVGSVLKYITKSDNYIAYGVDVQSYLRATVEKKTTKSAIIAEKYV